MKTLPRMVLDLNRDGDRKEYWIDTRLREFRTVTDESEPIQFIPFDSLDYEELDEILVGLKGGTQ